MRKILKYTDKALLIVSTILFSLGLIMVFSASNVVAYMSHAVSPYNYFIKQAFFLLSGVFICFVFLIRIPMRHYLKLGWVAMIGGIVALILLPFFGVEVNNAKSWFDLKFFNLQPSEFMKVITIIWLAAYYDKHKPKLNKYITVLFPMGVALAATVMIFYQPDLGTAIIYGLTVACIFFVSPIDKKLKAKIIIGGVGFALCASLILITGGRKLLLDRQLSRITEFQKPCDKLLSSGNQVCNCYIAINNGGITGVGLGDSTQKYLYLPEPYTDFIYAIIVEELGLIVGIAIIILYMILLFRVLDIGRKSYSDTGALICFGVAVYIFIHIAINLMGILGMMPMTGVPLPFMSYGGSFTWCLLGALTVVQRVNIETKLTEEKK